MIEEDSDAWNFIQECNQTSPEITTHLQRESTRHFTAIKNISRPDADRIAHHGLLSCHPSSTSMFTSSSTASASFPKLPVTIGFGKFNGWKAGLYVAPTAQSADELNPFLNWLSQLNISGTVTKKAALHLSLYRFRGGRGKRTTVYNAGVERIRTGNQRVHPTGRVRVKSIILKEQELEYDDCYVLAD